MTEPGFRQIQYAFAAYIRDPAANPPPEGVDDGRMRTYRELFFNNMKNFIGTGFPVLRQVLGEDAWLRLAQDFFARHRSATPYFSDFPEEFLAFLQEERDDHPEDPPFLLEVAHYEWVELALSIATGEPPEENPALLENPLACSLSLSEVAWPLAYRFPVQLIGADYQPQEPPEQPTCLAVYRDREDQVRFLELNPAAFRLLQIVEQEGPIPAGECLRRLAGELGHADPDKLAAYGEELLRELASRAIIGAA